MISIQQMQYILVLSEQRQFQRASELCYVTQPTLSMQVKKAEELLGYPIFDRSRNPLELTTYGEQLIPIIREILSETSKIDVLTQQMKGNYTEQIKIGVIPTIARYLVPEMFGVWQEKIGGIQLIIEELKTEDLLQAMENKALDVAILAGPFNDPKTRTIPLYTEEILVYSKEFDSSVIQTSQLMEMHPWLLSKGNCLRTQMIRFCKLKEETESDTWNYEGGNLELLIDMVDLHGGYTLVPENYKLNAARKNRLKHVHSGNQKTVPAREVIALIQHRTLKQQALDRLIREIQYRYSSSQHNNMEVLNWNG